MYHYIKDFPFAIESAANMAEMTDPELAKELRKYSSEEIEHEVFVLDTLVNIGIPAPQVETSEPLPSTKLIAYMMRDMFKKEPLSVFLMAALVEAQEFDEENISEFQREIERIYSLPKDSLAPYFKHQEIDNGLGHSELLSRNISRFKDTDQSKIDSMINKLHDLKHAFELQSLEIKNYYTDLQGKYFPRQPVNYSSI